MKKIIAAILLLSFFSVFNIYALAEAGYTSVIITTGEGFEEDLFLKTFNAVIKYRYKNSFSGISAEVFEDDIEKIKAFDGISGVYAQAVYKVPDNENVSLSLKNRLKSIQRKL